jgi:hypothetical protein
MSESALLQRYAELPRALRWLVIAVALTAAFLAWDSSIGALVRNWSAQADDIEANLAEIATADALQARMNDLRGVIQSIGPVEQPAMEGESRVALDRAVNDVLRAHTVSNQSFDLAASASQLPRDVSSGLVRSSERLRRITGELSFVASPETAIAIISELESRPEIEAISAVRLVIAGNRTLTVRLTLEAWARGEARRA